MPDPVRAVPQGDDPKARFLRFLMEALGPLTPPSLYDPMPGSRPADLARAAGQAPTSLTAGGSVPAPPPVGGGLLQNPLDRLNPWRVTPSPEGTPETLLARQAEEQVAAQQRAATGQLTPEEKGALARRNAQMNATPEQLAELERTGGSVLPKQEDPTLWPGPTPSPAGEYSTGPGATAKVGPGAAAAGGSFQGGSGVNTGLRPLDPNATYGAASKVPEHLMADYHGPQPGQPGSGYGMPDVGGLGGAFLGKLGSEGLLAQYQQNPEFAVYDLMSDVGANPRRNVYANYGFQKWAPIFAPLAALAETADPKAKQAYQNFVKAFVGGGDMGQVIGSAVKKALAGGAEGENARTVLTSLGPERLSQMISATRGESPIAAAARRSSMEMAQMEFMRQSQGRAQQGDLSDDQRAWLEYLLGQV